MMKYIFFVCLVLGLSEQIFLSLPLGTISPAQYLNQLQSCNVANLASVSVVANKIPFYFISPGTNGLTFLNDTNSATGFNTNINSTTKFKTIIHGWMNSIYATHIMFIAQTWVKKGFSVILVDWSYYANNTDYPSAAASCSGVGKVIADKIKQLNTTLNISLTSIHIVGHSLGAHVAGFAGKNIKISFGQSLPRITGLDPAGPCFQNTPCSYRLCSTDATTVDSVRTDMGEFGYVGPLGTVDFLVQGGIPPQPPCTVCPTAITANQMFGTPLPLICSYQYYQYFCSHVSACYYYNESIFSGNFKASRCSDYVAYQAGSCSSNPTVVMGDMYPGSPGGILYLDVNEYYPYATSGDRTTR